MGFDEMWMELNIVFLDKADGYLKEIIIRSKRLRGSSVLPFLDS